MTFFRKGTIPGMRKWMQNWNLRHIYKRQSQFLYPFIYNLLTLPHPQIITVARIIFVCVMESNSFSPSPDSSSYQLELPSQLIRPYPHQLLIVSAHTERLLLDPPPPHSPFLSGCCKSVLHFGAKVDPAPSFTGRIFPHRWRTGGCGRRGSSFLVLPYL
jgi:hypothetical protein